MTDDRQDEENVIETEEATAGGPATHDPTGTRLRAETRSMLTPDELDERQERISTTRRRGGPDVSGEPSEREAQSEEETEDIPPTETQPPPSP